MMLSETADIAPVAAKWRNCKPKVHNVLYCRQRRIEPRHQ